MLRQIEYLGHVIDEKGLHPTEDKIRAIKEAPTPKNITQLRLFLGILDYYGKFLPIYLLISLRCMDYYARNPNGSGEVNRMLLFSWQRKHFKQTLYL